MPDCSIRSVWRMVQGAIDSVLGKITLKDLLRSEPEMNAFSPSWTGSPSRRSPATPIERRAEHAARAAVSCLDEGGSAMRTNLAPRST
jgi:hypothetical protein